MNTITIKPMRPDEVNLQEIVSLTQMAFGELLKQDIKTPTAHISVQELERRHYTHYFGAYDEDRLIGFISGKLKDNHTFYMDILAVLPNYHHCGIGTHLMDAAEGAIFSLGVKYIYLNTMLPCVRNVEFYKNRNYLIYGIKNYTKQYYSLVFRKYKHDRVYLRIFSFFYFMCSYIWLKIIYRSPARFTVVGKLAKYMRNIAEGVEK